MNSFPQNQFFANNRILKDGDADAMFRKARLEEELRITVEQLKKMTPSQA